MGPVHGGQGAGPGPTTVGKKWSFDTWTGIRLGFRAGNRPPPLRSKAMPVEEMAANLDRSDGWDLCPFAALVALWLRLFGQGVASYRTTVFSPVPTAAAVPLQLAC
jgi:hypothetical protein